MTDEEIQLFRDYIRNYAGLVFVGSQYEIFKKRIKIRMEANSFSTAKEYYNFLRFDPRKNEELRELIDLVTVNETYFFRESMQMDAFNDLVLPDLKKEKEKLGVNKLKIWSAACSSGAEPYSLAILIKESGLFNSVLWKVEILGTDINSEILQVARQSAYSEPAFRATDKKIRDKYFQSDDKKLWKINDDIKSMVKFTHLNLFNHAQMKLMTDIDLILCRNVFIYFDDEGKKEIVKSFYNSLNPGGYLVVSQTESLFKITTLYSMKPMGKVLLYQKPHAGTK
jgi:chemotaxis protein methyltransferase CheR